MESGYSFTDFADMHLVLQLNGNATEVLQMLSELTEKWAIIRECQIAMLSFQFTAESKKLEHFTEYDVMLAAHFLFVTYRWKGKPSKQLRDSLATVLDVLQAVQAPSMRLYSVRHKSSSYSKCHVTSNKAKRCAEDKFQTRGVGSRV
jgi:hypothetical protein